MTTGTLTERYVHEVVRRIPADQRDDVANELRATIADTVEARDTPDRDAAEREVLTEMGDPIRLAARYADRPLALIGPELYPTYVRLLTLLLATVLPIVTGVSVVLDVLDHNDAGSAVSEGIGTLITVGAQMIGWLTLVFALAERYGRREVARTAGVWTPDDLKEVRRRPEGSATVYASAAWNALVIGLIVWQHLAEPYRGVPVLDPDLWSGWIWPILAGLAALVVLDLARAARGPSGPLAVGYAAAQALAALPMAWILYRQRFFNPDFLAEVRVAEAFYTIAALGVLVVTGTEVVRRFRETRA